MGPETKHVRACDVRSGDRIAIRNSAGGFVRWLRAVDSLNRQVIDTEDGSGYVVRYGDDLVEVARLVVGS